MVGREAGLVPFGALMHLGGRGGAGGRQLVGACWYSFSRGCHSARLLAPAGSEGAASAGNCTPRAPLPIGICRRVRRASNAPAMCVTSGTTERRRRNAVMGNMSRRVHLRRRQAQRRRREELLAHAAQHAQDRLGILAYDRGPRPPRCLRVPAPNWARLRPRERALGRSRCGTRGPLYASIRPGATL